MRWLKWTAVIVAAVLVAAAVLLLQRDLPAAEVDRRYTSAASQFLPAPSGARIHYRDEGPRAAPAVMLIHGANASLHTWEPWVRVLADRYRIVTLDLPGHGLTGAVPDADYSGAAQLRTVAAVAAHLGLQQFVLGGNSMGGGVSWRYALAHPEQVVALLLIDATGPPQWRSEARGSSSAPPLAFALLRQAWFRNIARWLDPTPLVRQGLLSAYNGSPVVNEALVARYSDLTLRAGTRQAILARAAAWRPGSQPAVDLSRLQQPALVMWGREDVLIPVATGERLASALPNAELIIYDNVGHAPMEEIPQRSATDVLTFLDALPPAAGAR